MPEINHDLLRKRMFQGAVTGAPEPEGKEVRYCKGKLDNNRPCRIVMLGEEEYCFRHRKEIAALEMGSPLPPGHVERPTMEGDVKGNVKDKTYKCSKSGCGRHVKQEGEACWQHKSSVAPGEAPTAEGNTGHRSVIEYDDEHEKAALAGAAIPGVNGGEKSEQLEHSPPEPEQYSARPTGLSALVRVPVAPPGLNVPFSAEEMVVLADSEVTPDIIREFVLMGLEGKLQAVA